MIKPELLYSVNMLGNSFLFSKTLMLIHLFTPFSEGFSYQRKIIFNILEFLNYILENWIHICPYRRPVPLVPVHFEVQTLFKEKCCVNYIALFCPTTLAAQFTWTYLTYKLQHVINNVFVGPLPACCNEIFPSIL